MEQLIEQKQPDLIICTHSFPSFLVNKLKGYGVCKTPIVNVYTDFFINDLWGKKHIDMHFVPSKVTKEQLIKASVPKENIIISGIVTNDHFLNRKKRKLEKEKVHVLVAGGSLGLGKQLSFLKDSAGSDLIEYRVLCGSNNKLYEKIASLKTDSIKPLTYITSPQQMNHLYNWADALVTKPGGVTISEALKKKIPIFIHSALPGQEERNMDYLLQQGLVQKLNKNKLIDDQIFAILNNPVALFEIKKAIHLFLSDIEMNNCKEVASYILNRLTNQSLNKRSHYIDQIFSRIYYSL
jgi:UDP-N-acetylglucosamine:LPS N-acetylglucosamine transferase